MMRRVNQTSRVFGMCAPSSRDGYSQYGTQMALDNMTLLPDGRALVSCHGVAPFRILDRAVYDDYNIALVERLSDNLDADSPPAPVVAAVAAATSATGLLQGFRQLLSRVYSELQLRRAAREDEMCFEWPTNWLRRAVARLYPGTTGPQDAAVSNNENSTRGVDRAVMPHAQGVEEQEGERPSPYRVDQVFARGGVEYERYAGGVREEMSQIPVSPQMPIQIPPRQQTGRDGAAAGEHGVGRGGGEDMRGEGAALMARAAHELALISRFQGGRLWQMLLSHLGPPPLDSLQRLSWWVAGLVSEVVPPRLQQAIAGEGPPGKPSQKVIWSTGFM